MLLSNITIGRLRKLAARQTNPQERAFLEEIARQMEADLDRLMKQMPGMSDEPTESYGPSGPPTQHEVNRSALLSEVHELERKLLAGEL